MKFFLWLSMTVNLMTGTGYFLFSGVMGIGDWDVVIRELESYWIWRTLLIMLGLALYCLTIWLSLVILNQFIGSKEPERSQRALRLTLFPYLFGSTAATLGALFNPISIFFVFTSAASTFGGTSGLAWMSQLYSTKLFPKIDHSPIMIRRKPAWIIIAVIFLVIHILVIGPGINFQ